MNTLNSLRLNNPWLIIQDYREQAFQQHAHYLHDQLLKPWAKEVLQKRHAKNPVGHKPNAVAVIVETRPNRLLFFSVINTIVMTKLRIKVIVFTNKESQAQTQSLFQGLEEWVQIKTLKATGKAFDIQAYNSLMKSQEFWASIPAHKCLIFQTDGLLIEPLENQFFEYDYIGAPWTSNLIATSLLPIYTPDLDQEIGTFPLVVKSSDIPEKQKITIGNGGFSIRNPKTMQLICSQQSSDKSEPEDIFFSRNIKSYSKKLPSLAEARRFACETTYFPAHAMHKSYLMLPPEQQAEIYDRHLRYLISALFATTKDN